MAANAQPIRVCLNLTNRFPFTKIFQFTNVAEQQSQNGRENLKMPQKSHRFRGQSEKLVEPSRKASNSSS